MDMIKSDADFISRPMKISCPTTHLDFYRQHAKELLSSVDGDAVCSACERIDDAAITVGRSA